MSYNRTKERWMVYLPKHQYEALTSLAKSLKDIKGSDLIVDAIENHIIRNMDNFKASIKKLQFKKELDEVNAAKALLLQKENDIKKKMREDGEDSSNGN